MPLNFLRNTMCHYSAASLALWLVLLTAAGCGQTGALYLPPATGAEAARAGNSSTPAEHEQEDPRRRTPPASEK